MGYLYNILPTFRKDWKCILVKGIYNKEQTSPIFRNGEKTSQSSRAFSRKIFLRQNLFKNAVIIDTCILNLSLMKGTPHIVLGLFREKKLVRKKKLYNENILMPRSNGPVFTESVSYSNQTSVSPSAKQRLRAR